MLPAWQAFLWILWRQHRWPLLVVFCSWLMGATVATVTPQLYSQDTVMGIFGLVVLPLVSVSLYYLIIFTYGLDGGDIVGSDSCFPASLFRLPVRTSTLALWPMAIGAVTVFLFTFATAGFVLRPWLSLWVRDANVRSGWPSIMAVAVLAWFQAMLWTPFGIRWLRVVLVLILVQGAIALPIYGTHDEDWLAIFFTALAVMGWVVGYIGLRHARHGEVPNWNWIISLPSQLFGQSSRSHEPFASAAAAQRWFEWRVTGKMFPIMVGVMAAISFVLVILFNSREVIGMWLACTLGVPLLTASAAGWFGSRRSRWAKGKNDMMPFVATLPMTTAVMVGAKLKTAAWTTVITWAIIAVLWPFAAVLTEQANEFFGTTLWRQGVDAHTALRIAAGTVAFTIVLLIYTWKRKLDWLYVGLIRSKWLEAVVAWGTIPGTYFLYLYVIVICTSPLSWNETAWWRWILMVWPWVLVVPLLLRLLIAGWALKESLRQGLLQPRTVARWATAWLLLAVGLYILLVFALGEPALLDLAFAVVFALPIVRLAAAPLALAWHRHR